MVTKSTEELWEIAQEINKKELSKDEVCKKHGISTRTFTRLIQPTYIRYKNKKDGYVCDEKKINEDIEDRTISKEIEPNNENEIVAASNDDSSNINNKAGRPRVYSEGHTELKKLTLEIDKTVYNALQFKKITEGITINKYIENLLRQNVEPVYFNTVKNLNK